MKRLVIAEKPSVGMSIASVLGARDRKDGYIEGRDYIVSWGFGHLAELANADTYDEKYAKWRYDDLPIVPANWKYKIPRDKYSQFETLKKLMNRADVSDVINACDAGREGELIFRNIYKMTGCKKPIYRLWISSMEDNAIEQGFRDLKDGKEYDNLFAAARCREWADWLVGINATRLFSILYHRTLNVGRVVSPTLALIVQREAEIGAFKPEPFYTAELDFGSFTATSEKFKKKSDADAVIPKAGEPVVVKSVTSKEKTEKAPALYDLTTLQRDANRQLGYTAQQTLDYVQSLYEKKLCTYPRTDSRYLTDDMADGVNAVVACSVGICDEAAPPEVLSRQICNSKKVSDHHAIIPTLVAGETDINALPAGEREIIKLIAKQVLRAVCDSFRYCETVAVISCGDRTFTAKGKTVQNPGWKIYNEKEQTDKVLPELADGDELKVANAEIKEGTTKPPAHFTEDSFAHIVIVFHSGNTHMTVSSRIANKKALNIFIFVQQLIRIVAVESTAIFTVKASRTYTHISKLSGRELQQFFFIHFKYTSPYTNFFSKNCFATRCIVSSTKFAYSPLDIVINLFIDLSGSGK